jgi:hypothetical protein
MILYFIILLTILLYITLPLLKEKYIYYYKIKLADNFSKICKKYLLNLRLEDSFKISNNKISFRYTYAFHAMNFNLKQMYEIYPEQILKDMKRYVNVDKELIKKILPLCKMGMVEEFHYGKDPFSPYEKLYVGYFKKQKIGYLMEKKGNVYTKRIYIITNRYNLDNIFPKHISNELNKLMDPKIIEDECFYKYEENNEKPISCYIKVNKPISLVLDIYTKILLIFNNNQKTIDNIINKLDKFRDSKCTFLGLTYSHGEYFATIYYNPIIKN